MAAAVGDPKMRDEGASLLQNVPKANYGDAGYDFLAKQMEAKRSVSFKQIAKLAVPASLTKAAPALASVFLTAIYGRGLGSQSLAAFAVVSSSLAFLVAPFSSVNAVVTAQVQTCIASGHFNELRRRVLLALCAGVLLGGACAGSLFAVRRFVFGLFAIDSALASVAMPYSTVLIGALPLYLLRSTCVGILNGFGRVRFAMWGQSLCAVIDVLGNLAVVWWWDAPAGLSLCAWASVFATSIGLLFMLAIVSFVPPFGVPPQVFRLLPLFCSPISASTTNSPRAPAPCHSSDSPNVLQDFLHAAKNTLARAMLLWGAVLLVTVFSGRLGIHALAATQIGFQVWMLSSCLIDGLETAGNIITSRILGQPRTLHWLLPKLCVRLALLGCSVGLGFTFVLWAFRPWILRSFTSDQATLDCLCEFWWLVALFQPLNALVFTYDGVLYATQSFVFVRNWLFFGFALLFLPCLGLGYFQFGSLLGLWAAKAVLNLWRAAFAVYRIHVHFFPLWARGPSAAVCVCDVWR